MLQLAACKDTSKRKFHLIDRASGARARISTQSDHRYTRLKERVNVASVFANKSLSGGRPRLAGMIRSRPVCHRLPRPVATRPDRVRARARDSARPAPLAYPFDGSRASAARRSPSTPLSRLNDFGNVSLFVGEGHGHDA